MQSLLQGTTVPCDIQRESDVSWRGLRFRWDEYMWEERYIGYNREMNVVILRNKLRCAAFS